MILSKSSYFDIFQVDAPLLDKLVQEAMASGGNYADLYFENTTYGNLTLRDGIVNAGGRHIDYGVGIRVLCGEKTAGKQEKGGQELSHCFFRTMVLFSMPAAFSQNRRRS